MKKHYPRNMSAGTLRSWELLPNALKITTDTAYIRIEAYRHDIINVSASLIDAQQDSTNSAHKNTAAPPFPSQVVIAEPAQDLELSLDDSSSELRLTISKKEADPRTARVVSCCKKNFCLHFFNGEGALLNQDHPDFSLSWLGRDASVYKTLREDECFLGLGEKTGPVNRRGRRYRNSNQEIFAYGVEDDPIYQSNPFYIGIHNKGMYGIYLDAVCESFFDFAASNERFTSFTCKDSDISYFFFYGNSIPDILEAYTWLCGRPQFPPLWAMGYHQSRYSYGNAGRALDIAHGFRNRNIPLDAIHFDIHYMQDYKVFTWNTDRFPEPGKTIAELRSMDVHAAVIIDPGIKVEAGYDTYETLNARKWMLRYPDGEPYIGEVWPGKSLLPDFSKTELRSWWGENMAEYVDAGVRGFWNDMNEPSVWGHSIPDMVEMDNDGNPVSMRDFHNIYGLQMARATYEGVRSLLPEERSFFLTRSGFAGIQRYAAVWTGDNVSSKEHMMLAVRLLSSLSISGIPFCGCDVGGFAGDCSAELFSRWIAWSAFTPFFRGHSIINSKDAEPWAFGERAEEIARNYITLRYRIMPYLYTLAYNAHRCGLPILSPMAVYYPYNKLVYKQSYENQFFCGRDILVIPCMPEEQYQKIYLPAGLWYDFYTDTPFDAGKEGREILLELHADTIPVFVRAGAVIPMRSMQDKMRALSAMDGDCLVIHLYRGADNSFSYFEDDGISYGYEKNVYHMLRVDYTGKKINLRVIRGKSRFTRLKLCLHGGTSNTTIVLQTEGAGRAEISQPETLHFVQAVSNFDPLGTQKDPQCCAVHSISCKYPEDTLTFRVETP